MAYTPNFAASEPGRADIEAMAGPLLLEFGTQWCGYCQGVQPLLEAALSDHPELAHVKVADGPGRHLGRSYKVKLWPTLIFLRDGVELSRLVRPSDAAEIRLALDLLETP